MKAQNTVLYPDVKVEESAVSLPFLGKVYGLMSFAIIVTIISAYFTIKSGLAFKLVFSFSGTLMVFLLLIVQIGIVVALSAKIKTLSSGAATLMLFAYSFLTGITLSYIVFYYKIGGIISAFSGAVIMFLLMAGAGYFLKIDLTKIGTVAVMGLIGIILASIFNMFLGIFGLYSTSFDFVISAIGVLIFAVLIAWDSQKMKNLSVVANQNEEEASKYAVMGALALYLDFINMFLFLLRLFGRNS